MWFLIFMTIIVLLSVFPLYGKVSETHILFGTALEGEVSLNRLEFGVKRMFCFFLLMCYYLGIPIYMLYSNWAVHNGFNIFIFGLKLLVITLVLVLMKIFKVKFSLYDPVKAKAIYIKNIEKNKKYGGEYAFDPEKLKMFGFNKVVVNFFTFYLISIYIEILIVFLGNKIL